MAAVKNGSHVSLITQDKLPTIGQLKSKNLIYGHYVYIFGAQNNKNEEALKLVYTSSLIVYVKSDDHNEMLNFIKLTRIPFIVATNSSLILNNKASMTILVKWASKNSMLSIANELAKYLLQIASNVM